MIDLTADTEVVVDSNTLGYPRESLLDLEDGTYYVQAELVLYDKYTRANLPPVSLPTTCVVSQGTTGPPHRPSASSSLRLTAHHRPPPARRLIPPIRARAAPTAPTPNPTAPCLQASRR